MSKFLKNWNSRFINFK